jgi:hypothetical protein
MSLASFLEVFRLFPLLLLLVAASACSGGDSLVERQSLTVSVEAAPPPPRGALVLGGESGTRAVALAVKGKQLTATVLGGNGGPRSGLNVSFRVAGRAVRAHPCGPGCYSASAPRSRRVEVRLRGTSPVVFSVPASVKPAAAIVAKSGRVVRGLRSFEYVEALRSRPTGGIVTTWRMAAPNRVTYEIRNGAEAVVIGRRRWDRDRAGEKWRLSPQIPALRVPQPAWGRRVTNAYVLGTTRVEGRPVWVVSFANPATPAFFTTWIDRQNYRPLRLKMTAAAHFMAHRYTGFDEPMSISPPR